MLSNMNQQSLDGIGASMHIGNTFYNVTTHSHSTKNESKEFSIYRPDVDFSVNYEPVGEKMTRLVNDAKEAATTHNGENGRKAVMTTIGFNHYDPTNLHNYSKVPESVTLECSDKNNNKNVTVEAAAGSDQDEDHRDDNNNPSNKVDDKKPEHHIRRPMNAFLIFCKRHRALVREKYPNLENRSITKILGDWWAFLPNEDKSPYKELAKNYKDVFFSKNPNFKWYKLPAPPLRTLSTRPTNDRSMVASPTPIVNEEIVESTIKDRAARNIKPQNSLGFGQFKFASIDQMGGLTSLLAMDNGAKVNGINLYEKDDEKSEMFELPGKKRKSDEQLEIYDDQEVAFAGKSHRACKGKRYEQFMTPSKKATKPKSTNTVTSTSVHFPHNGYCKPLEAANHKQDDSSDELSNIAAASPESDEAEQRNADAADFKLNEKIMTLPSLDLDDYLNRKKAMKKKKKFTHKAKHRQQQAQAAPKEKAIPKPTVVGSQKRKAPKQTIRRTADINQPEISRELIGLDTLATLALVQANSNSTSQ